MIDFDPYLDRPDTNPDTTLNTKAVDALHDRGGYAICYVDAGSIERYRPDFERFRRWDRSHEGSLLGNPFSKRFPNERWANIGGAEQRAFLLQMMERRTANCEQTGFDAVEYDVVAAHESGKRVTGFDVSARDQLAYNRGLAAIGHEHGLAVGLKNDLGQVRQLIDDFDFAINEECAGYDECKLLKPFAAAGKPVFHVEYTLPPRAILRGDGRARLQLDQEGGGLLAPQHALHTLQLSGPEKSSRSCFQRVAGSDRTGREAEDPVGVIRSASSRRPWRSR